MNKRFFTVMGTVYVCFALSCAYSYHTKSTARLEGASAGDNMGSCYDRAAPDSGMVWRTTAYSPEARVVVWGVDECYGCRVFKETQVPILEDAGIEVLIKNAREDNPPDDVDQFPTIIIYDGDTEVDRFTGDVPAEKILEVVPQAEEEETPDYLIWDIFSWWS